MPGKRAVRLRLGASGAIGVPLPQPGAIRGAKFAPRMREIAATRVRYGYRKIRAMLQPEGFEISKKLAYRFYREEGPSLRYRPSRRRRMQTTRPMRTVAAGPNAVWGLDFGADQLSQGPRF